MADTEFEQFRFYFDRLPQHFKAPSDSYILVHDVTLDDESPTSSPRDEIDNEIVMGAKNNGCNNNVTTTTTTTTTCGVDSEDEDVVVLHRHEACNNSGHSSADEECEQMCCSSIVADSDFSLFAGLMSNSAISTNGSVNNGRGNRVDSGLGSEAGGSCTSLSSWPTPEHHRQSRSANLTNGTTTTTTIERRRRRLPEIPKNRRPTLQSSPSLAEELEAVGIRGQQLIYSGQLRHQSTIVNPNQQKKRNNHRHHHHHHHHHQHHDDSSPDSERLDSGHSTAHSPDFNGPKSISPSHQQQQQQQPSTTTSATTMTMTLTSRRAGSASPEFCDSTTTPGCSSIISSTSSNNSTGMPFNQLELLEATHRGLHRFVPRHRDEIDLEIGDPIYVQKEADDLWCEGVNLRTGRQGIFPSAYAVDMDYSDFDPAAPKVKKERYLLGYLGSVETLAHKGTSVVCQAVRRIVGNNNNNNNDVNDAEPTSQSCILEVSDQGLRMLDRSKRRKSTGPCHDYFYSLKNVSFCAFHPNDHRYLGFITKHPTLQRFACHVFIGQESTRPVAEAVGRAFHRFYTKFIETAFPIEDIYIE